MLLDQWLRQCLRLTFQDEFDGAGLDYLDENHNLLFNVFLHGLPEAATTITHHYDWFQNVSDAGAPCTPREIIVTALDSALANLGNRPWGTDQRGSISFVHEMIGEVHATPMASRSTYAHCIELGDSGPVHIESMFPLGQSGTILMDESGHPVFDSHFYSMTPEFDGFSPRPFPLLAATAMPADAEPDGDLDGRDLAVYAQSFGPPGLAPFFRFAGWFGQLQPE